MDIHTKLQKNIMRNYFLLSLKCLVVCALATLCCACREDARITAAYDLIERVTPGYGEQFKLELIEPEDGQDVYEIDAEDGKVVLRGNNTVAIATALMPPLCTAGFGIATGNIYYFLGAFYLFFINTVFISLATYLGVRMMKFKQKQFINEARYKRVRQYIIGAVIATMVPAAFMTYHIVRNSIFDTNVSKFINEQLDNAGTRIISYDVNKDSLTLRVVAVGRELTDSSIANAEKTMAGYKLGRYKLHVIQGTETDSIMMLNNRINNIRTSSENYAAMFHEEAKKSARLQESLNEYSRYDELTPEIAKEVHSLFPQTDNISLSVATESLTDTTAIKRYVIAVIGMKKRSQFSDGDKEKITKWLETRLGIDTISVIVK